MVLTSKLGVPCSGRRVACDLVTHHFCKTSLFLLLTSCVLSTASLRPALKLRRCAHSVAATLAALPSISENPFLDS
jgi:hypothetical protein